MSVSIKSAANERTLNVEIRSVFVFEDARRIEVAIANAAPGTEVDIEFLKVRECEAPALASLANLMRSARAHVALRGISGHFYKLLGYLGMPPDSLRHGPLHDLPSTSRALRAVDRAGSTNAS